MKADELFELTAEDLMKRDVLYAEKSDRVQDAMAKMIDHRVTGLPVLDQRRRCVGVVSATDILAQQRESQDEMDDGGRYYDPDTGCWESLSLTGVTMDGIPDVRVSEIMSPRLFAVLESTSLREVARTLKERSIHRVLVLDADRNLRGIISASDFVRLIADTDPAD